MLAVNIFGLASAHIHHRAHSLRLADNARVLCFSSFAALCWFAFDQTLGDQRVAADLKGVEVPNTDTALEEASILGAKLCKFAHFLGNIVLKGLLLRERTLLTSFAHCHQHEEASPVVVSFPSQYTVLVKGNP